MQGLIFCGRKKLPDRKPRSRPFPSLTKKGFKFYTRTSFRVISPRRLCLYSVTLLIALVFGYFLYQYIIAMNAQIQPLHYIWTLGILLATLGWVTTVSTHRYISRRQHTMNVLLQHRFNNHITKHMQIIHARFPVGTPITQKDAKKLVEATKSKHSAYGRKQNKLPPLDEVHGSLVVMLNYYEFLAIGIKQRDLDARVMEDFYNFMLTGFSEKAREFIKFRQSSRPSLYENLVDLYRAWKPSTSFPEAE